MSSSEPAYTRQPLALTTYVKRICLYDHAADAVTRLLWLESPGVQPCSALLPRQRVLGVIGTLWYRVETVVVVLTASRLPQSQMACRCAPGQGLTFRGKAKLPSIWSLTLGTSVYQLPRILGADCVTLFNKEDHPVRIQSLASIILNLKVGQDVAVGRTRVSLRCFTSSDGLSAIFTHTSGETYFQAASSATRTEASSWMLCQAYSILLPGCILPKWQQRTGHKPATQLCNPSIIHG